MYESASRPYGNKSTIPQTYEQLMMARSNYLARARDYSLFTLPYILPETHPRTGPANQHGFQSIGAQAVNHLANKLVMTLFPPQRSYFKLELTESAEADLNKAGFSKVDLAEQMAAITRRAQRVQESSFFRSASTEAAKHLIITGNSCIYAPKGAAVAAIPLSHYVVSRSMSGELLHLIILQERELSKFEPAEQMMIRASNSSRRDMKPNDKVKLYTEAKLNGDLFEVKQSAFEYELGKMQRVSKESLPWIPLRWNTCYGEDYGRGLVEDNAGDFFVIEFLSRAVARGMALMADVKYLVKPGATVDIDELIGSPTGEYVYGNIDDIGILQLAKYADFTPIAEVLQEYKRRIGHAFLMQSANRRNAERVTAEELRMDATELETSLGGVYSHLAGSWQHPFAMLMLKRVDSNINGHDFDPQILTGLEALGRRGELDKLAQFTEIMQLTNSWPQMLQNATKFEVLARKVAADLGMEVDWLMTEEETDELNEQNAMRQAEMGLMQEASKAAPDLIKEQIGG